MHGPGRVGCSCRRANCPSPGKHPKIAWTAATEQAAGLDQIEAWWGRWPDANVAVATGTVSGVVVLDIDPRHGGDTTLVDLQAAWSALPPTLESRTGGGGRHLWYLSPSLRLQSAELGPGVELKAEGGLVTAPPSRHASGGTYEWIDEHQPLAPLPDWVASLGHRRPLTAHGDPHGPPRTDLERREFVDAWEEVGIEIGSGDAYYLCPFHDDHHPSLHIDYEGCRWYCFGCRSGGGIGGLRRKLGHTRSIVPRARLRGFVGSRRPVTIVGEAPVEVVGESFHQDELLRLAGGVRRYGGFELEAVALLVPVEGEGIEVSIDEATVGFLNHPDRETFENLIHERIGQDGAATCRAMIRGGWDRGGDDVGYFGVTLYMPGDND